ncbi:hypothetical protein SteCoe_14396 [Stentor coeruleus]|uniref:Myb-like DNA-binding domain containing protein n=1 Tax=Stentor coeruleus TaxID=5963 RepID=A0A1R2C682_9CILI|nr:hypothetical protein SteCoe_15300 [Stentor coeruleus]OMJ84507.1 hypothetical protein SteCoe_14396 [Stentor coeruleus]
MEIKTGKVWTLQEDLALIDLINTIGCNRWTRISNEMSNKYGILNRSPKQCRDRWVNNVDPAIVKNIWTKEEDDILFDKYSIFGNKWCKISKFLHRRCGNSIKNRFYSIVRINLRKYNKSIPEEYKLKGSLKFLLNIKNIRDILVKRPETNESNDESQEIYEVDEEENLFINNTNELNEEFVHSNYAHIIKKDENEFVVNSQNMHFTETVKNQNYNISNTLESNKNQNSVKTDGNIFRVFLKKDKSDKILQKNQKKSKEPEDMVDEIQSFYKSLICSSEKSQEILSKFANSMTLPYFDFSSQKS